MAVAPTWKRFDGHNFDSLVIKVGDGKRKILILMDCPEREIWGDDDSEEESEDVVLAADRLGTVKNVIGWTLQSLKKQGEPYDCTIIFSAALNDYEDGGLKGKADSVILQIRPHVVMACGTKVGKLLTEGSPQKYYGRLRPATISGEDKLSYKLMWSIPVFGWTNPKPAVKGDDAGALVNLIGQFTYHLETAITGKHNGTIRVPKKVTFTTIDTVKKFDAFYAKLLKCETPSIDLETVNLAKRSNSILTFHCYLHDREDPQPDYSTVFAIPLRHKEAPWLSKELSYIEEKLRHYFEFGKSRYIIFAHGKFDITQFYTQLGARWFNHRMYDVAGGEYCLDESLKFIKSCINIKPYALESIEYRYGYRRENVAIAKDDRSNMASKKLEDICLYGSIDVITPALIHDQQLKIAKKRGLKRFALMVSDQLGILSHAMARMEAVGIYIDAEYLQSLQADDSVINKTVRESLDEMKLSEKAQAYNDSLVKDRGFEKKGLFGAVTKPWVLDLGSPEHKRGLFFKTLRLKPLSYGKSGEPSVDKNFMDAYKNVPEVKVFRKYSKMVTLRNNFSTNLHERLLTDPDSRGGRISSSYHYLEISTGRSGCFAWDTPVYVLDDRETVPIKSIKKGDWIWAFDTFSYLPVPVQLKKDAWCSGIKPTVKVSYAVRRKRKSVIETVECTVDHKFLLVSGKWVSAGKLKCGDRVISMQRSYHRGYRELWFTNQVSLTGKNGQPEHRCVKLGAIEPVDATDVEVHHEDGNKANNAPSNLEILDRLNHGRLHWEEKKHILVRYAEDNLAYKVLPGSQIVKALRRSKNLTEAASLLGVNAPLLTAKCREHEVAPEKHLPPQFRPTKKFMLSEFKKHGYRAVATCKANGWDFDSFKRRLAAFGVDYDSLVCGGTRERWKELSEKQLATIGKRIDSGVAEYTIYGEMGMDVRTFYRLFYCDSKHRKKKGRVTKKMVTRASSFSSYANVSAYLWCSANKARELLKSSNNHEIVSVVSSGRRIKVYDIEVPEYANFVANGLCVHNSRDPNFQNQPSQGPLAKIIKRIFSVPAIVYSYRLPLKKEWEVKASKVLLKADFSAHEVRGLGNVSGDKVIKKAFETARQAIFDVRTAGENYLEEAKERLKRDGDIHITNVKIFFGQVVDKSHPLRYNIKAIVFGVAYGMGAASLGAGLRKGVVTRIEAIREDLNKLKKELLETAGKVKKVVKPMSRKR